jgi:hypothetical protein
MINWIKTNVLGIRPVVQKSKPKKVAGGPSGKSAAKASSNVASKKITKAGLEKLTKVQIDELAKSEMSIELDRRKTKDAMIKDYLAAQKKK